MRTLLAGLGLWRTARKEGLRSQGPTAHTAHSATHDAHTVTGPVRCPCLGATGSPPSPDTLRAALVSGAASAANCTVARLPSARPVHVRVHIRYNAVHTASLYPAAPSPL